MGGAERLQDTVSYSGGNLGARIHSLFCPNLLLVILKGLDD